MTAAAALSDAAAKLIAEGRLFEAMLKAEQAIAVDPNFALAHCNLGLALNLLHHHEDAVVSFRRALECDPTKQWLAVNLGDSLMNLGRTDEALQQLHMAHLTMPLAVIKANLASAYYGIGEYDKAEAYFLEAIHQDVWLAKAHSNLAICYLQQGRWTEGWAKYGWRFAADGVDVRETELRTWDGGSVASLLVLCEQGLGEEIFWLGMLADLQARGIKVWLEADKRLHPLIARSFPDVGLISRIGDRAVPDGCLVEAVCDAGDLGQYFRNTAADFYRDKPEYLHAVRTSRLGSFNGLTVGISWHSTNATFGPLKSAPLKQWDSVLDVDGVRFISLQYGDHGADPRVAAVPGLDVKDDIDGLASVITECDLVITVSNTTAHLACALGVRTWVLQPLGYGRFWYWGPGERTPWYPSATLFQNKTGWPDVFARVREALERQVHRSFLVDEATRHVRAV